LNVVVFAWYDSACLCGMIQRGGEMFPKDANGQLIYDDIHYIETWKVRTNQ